VKSGEKEMTRKVRIEQCLERSTLGYD